MKIELNDVKEALETLNAGQNRFATVRSAFAESNGDVEGAWSIARETWFPDGVEDVAIVCAKAGKTTQGSAFLEGKVILPSGMMLKHSK
jgi:hypothetical protein